MLFQQAYMQQARQRRHEGRPRAGQRVQVLRPNRLCKGGGDVPAAASYQAQYAGQRGKVLRNDTAYPALRILLDNGQRITLFSAEVRIVSK